tara:strand:- start:61 stop:447 length:387 start_codon:yes stop_codon:yes gene_type:complete
MTASVTTRKSSPRKTRTRKTSSTKKSSPLNTVTKLPVVMTEETKVEEKVVTKPELSRPAEPNISLEEYISDFKVRWKIHSFETTILWNQSVNLYTQTLKPSAISAYEYVKTSYDKAFNTEVESKEDNN